MPDGAPDPSFSDDGLVTTPILPGDRWDEAFAVTLQPDGKIVVAGQAGQFAVVRYDSDGTPDDTFSDDGVQTVDIGAGNSTAFGVAIDTLGRIVVVGDARASNPVSNDDAAFARLTPAGDPTRLLRRRMLTIELTGDGGDHVAAVAPLADGGFVVAGFAAHLGPPGSQALAMRFSQNGDLVPDGVSRSGRLLGSGAAIQALADGSVVISGGAAPPARVRVMRLLPNGRYDTSFSGDGEDSVQIVAGTPDPIFQTGQSVAVQGSGRIVVGVYAQSGATGPHAAFGLLRFLPGGELDPSFAGDGRQATRFGPGDASLFAVALHGPDRILAAGTEGLGTGDADFALARYDGGVGSGTGGGCPVARGNRGPDSDIRRLRRRVRARTRSGSGAPRATTCVSPRTRSRCCGRRRGGVGAASAGGSSNRRSHFSSRLRSRGRSAPGGGRSCGARNAQMAAAAPARAAAGTLRLLQPRPPTTEA